MPGERIPGGVMAHWTEMTALRKLYLHMNHIESAYRDLPNLGKMCNLRELHILSRWRVSLEGMGPEDQLYAPLSQHPCLEVLELPVNTGSPIILDHISLSNLSTLTLHGDFYHGITTARLFHGDDIPVTHFIPSLARLVSRCPRLEVLSINEAWRITQCRDWWLKDWWLTVQLLCQLEMALLHSRAAPSLPVSQSEGRESSSFLLRYAPRPPSDSRSLPGGMGVPKGSSEVGGRLQASLSSSRPLVECSTNQGEWFEAMDCAVLGVLREREKYRGGGEMVRPLLVSLRRDKSEDEGRERDNELLEEEYVQAVFTRRSPVLRVVIEIL